MTDELKTIATFSTAAEASPVQTTLEQNGIRTCLQGGTSADILSHVAAGLSGVQLQVARNDVERALACLGWNTEAENETPIAAWTCGTCGEAVDAGFEVCWNCGAAYDDPPGTSKSDPEPPPEIPGRECPMCGGSLPEDAVECRHCGERIDGPSYDDPHALGPEGEPSDAAQRAGELLDRAYRTAMIGLILCPPFVSLYAMFTLAEYNRLRADYGLPKTWRLRVAWIASFVGATYPFFGYMTVRLVI